MALVVAAAIFLHQNATAGPATVDLGTAANFAILGGSAVTFTAPTTTVTGDVGVWQAAPGASITGTPANLTLMGSSTIHNNDAVAQQAQSDLTAAYLAAAAAPFSATIPNSLGSGQTLGPGVYKFTLGTTVNLIGNLNLSGSGLFVFQVPADLQTATGSSVSFFEGADSCDVIWQVTSSANLLGSDFDGTILALTSITLGAGVTVDGRLLAQTGLVSLINDTIITDNCQPGEGTGGVPDTGSTLLLLSSGLATVFAFRRWSLVTRRVAVS
jgi:hypothetical protein